MHILSFFLLLAFFIFLIGILGVIFIRRHLIIILISLELMILSADFIFVLFSVYLDDIFGLNAVFLVLTVAAAEVAIGLGIAVAFYRLNGSINIDLISLLKG